jgi:hypothetical protein
MNADTEYVSGMIAAYVPDADQFDPRDLLTIAQERDQAAAESFVKSAETQLQMERAAAAINTDLDEYYQTVDWTLFSRVY